MASTKCSPASCSPSLGRYVFTLFVKWGETIVYVYPEHLCLVFLLVNDDEGFGLHPDMGWLNV